MQSATYASSPVVRYDSLNRKQYGIKKCPGSRPLVMTITRLLLDMVPTPSNTRYESSADEIGYYEGPN